MSVDDAPHDPLHDDNNHDGYDLQKIHHQQRHRPHSIDESLELERQLMDEPLSPSSPRSSVRPVSLDPHVLSAIVANLRQSLADMTRERDDLVASLAESHTHRAELKEALSIVSDKCNTLDVQLVELRQKSQADDEAIAMLRTKVEESRRGLMRLQTESRRMSQASSLSLDTSRTSASHFTFGGQPASSKRASFVPLTGSGAVVTPRTNAHRRVSSVSDSGYTLGDHSMPDHTSFSTSPKAQTISFSEDMRAATAPSSSRRISGFFGRSSPPQQTLEVPSDAVALEVEALRRELVVARTELEDLRHEVTESNEAREASELCVNALRSFISENAIGEHRGNGNTVKLPPFPTDATGDEPDSKRPVSGWSALKLWRVDTGHTATPATRKTGPGPGPDQTARSPVSTPASESMPPPPTAPTAPVAPAVPLSKKIGDFFSSRNSISSASSQCTPHSHQQEPMCNGSDCSSVDESEPVSPRDAGVHGSVVVRGLAHGPSSEMGAMLDSTDPAQAKTSLESEQRGGTDVGIANSGD